MTADDVIKLLKSREQELKALGIDRLSLFGSVARGDQRADSDVDLAAEFDGSKVRTAFHQIELENKLAGMLGVPVDLLSEPARRPRLQARLERDRVRVF